MAQCTERLKPMKHTYLLPLFLALLLGSSCYSQPYKGRLKDHYMNGVLREMYTPQYIAFKDSMISCYSDHSPRFFGEYISGVYCSLETDRKEIALTFDACMGSENSYNSDLIDFLRKERIPATLFVTGSWIDGNREVFLELSADTLFEIANHGLFHRVCSVSGRSAYSIQPTMNLGEVIDEMELNARKIESMTGRRPQYFRSSTGYLDDVSIKIAGALGMQVVNYSLISGDGVPQASAETLKNTILKGAKQGAIVIMHFNHPQWHEKKALEMALPSLRDQGYRFVRLSDAKLKTQ